MHDYTITDLKTGEATKLVAPNRDAALKAYVKRRLVVVRVAPGQSTDANQHPQGAPFELPGERAGGSVG